MGQASEKKKNKRGPLAVRNTKSSAFILIFFSLTFAFLTRATDFDEKEGLLVVQLLLIRTPQVIKGDRTEVILDFEES